MALQYTISNSSVFFIKVYIYMAKFVKCQVNEGGTF